MLEPQDTAEAEMVPAAKTKLWRYSLLVDDPQPVFDWLEEHVPCAAGHSG